MTPWSIASAQKLAAACHRRMVGRIAVFELAPGGFTDAHGPLLEKELYEPE